MKRLIVLGVIAFFAFSSSSVYASNGADLTMEIQQSGNNFVVSKSYVFEFNIKNIGSQVTAPSTLNYFYIPDTFEVVDIFTEDENFYCPVANQKDGVLMLGCTSEPTNTRFRALNPQEQLTIGLQLRVVKPLDNGTEIIGLHFPDKTIEPHESKAIDEFFWLSKNELPIKDLDTNNLAIWKYQSQVNKNLNVANNIDEDKASLASSSSKDDLGYLASLDPEELQLELAQRSFEAPLIESSHNGSDNYVLEALFIALSLGVLGYFIFVTKKLVSNYRLSQ